VIAIRSARAVRRLAALGTVATLAVTLAGCGSAGVGAAAVVDGNRISVADVQQATEQINVYSGQQVPQSQVLYFLIIGPRLIEAAAEAGVGVSPDDAKTELQQKVADPGGATITAVQANEALNRLGSLGEDKGKPILDSVVADLRTADIEVNPRYGSFDSDNLIMAEDGANWFDGETTSGS
jgi:hypothetical protein